MFLLRAAEKYLDEIDFITVQNMIFDFFFNIVSIDKIMI